MRHILPALVALGAAVIGIVLAHNRVMIAQEEEPQTVSNNYSTHVGNTIPESFSSEMSEVLWLNGRIRDLRRRAAFFSVDLTEADVDRLQDVIHDVWVPALAEHFPEHWNPEYRRLWTTIEALQVDMVERANDRELTVESEQEVMALADALRRSAEGNGAN